MRAASDEGATYAHERVDAPFVRFVRPIVLGGASIDLAIVPTIATVGPAAD